MVFSLQQMTFAETINEEKTPAEVAREGISREAMREAVKEAERKAAEAERKAEKEEAKEAIKEEAIKKYKRESSVQEENQDNEKENNKESEIRKIPSKLVKILPTEKNLEDITKRIIWRYVDKQSTQNEETNIETMTALLRDITRVYDPIVNKYKVATIQIEIIKYEDNEKLRNYWINEKKSNLEFMFENAYLIGSITDNTKCFFNYTIDGAITICKTDQYVIQSVIFDKYQEHFKYTKSKTGTEKLELTQYEITAGITETILKKLQSDDPNYDYELYKILESNREIKEREINDNEKEQSENKQKEKQQRANDEKNKNKLLGIEKDRKYGIQNFSCIKDEFGLIKISGQFNNNQIKKDKVSFEIAFFDYEKNMVGKNTANLLEIDEYETKRFLGNLKIDKNFATCTIKLNN
jgi:hypothetical protein